MALLPRSAYGGGAHAYAEARPSSPVWGGILSHTERINRRFAQDRQHEINMREMEYLAARQALGLDIPGQARGGSQRANRFLQRWEQEQETARGIYNQALRGLGGTFESLRTAEGAATQLGDLAGRVEQEYQGFVSEMAPLQQQMMGMAEEEGRVRSGLLAQFPALAAYDPEGAAGRAIAGVAQQAGQARQAEARRLAGLGIDPTSGRAMAAMRGMAGTEALGRAMAGTAARQQERARAGALTAQGLQLIDPSRAAQTALGIRRGASELLGMAGNLLGQQAQTLGGLASTRAGVGQAIGALGGSYAQQIAQPYADIAGLQMGLQYRPGQQLDLGSILANRRQAGGGRAAVAFGGGGGSIGTPAYNQAQEAEREAFFGRGATGFGGEPVGMV